MQEVPILTVEQRVANTAKAFIALEQKSAPPPPQQREEEEDDSNKRQREEDEARRKRDQDFGDAMVVVMGAQGY